MTVRYANEEDRKAARAESQRKYYAKNPHYYKDYNRQYRKDNYEELCRYSLWNNCKDRSKKKGLEFTIELSDIVIPEFCPILGIKLQAGFSKSRDDSPSVDRVHLHKGYTPDNIQVISYLANRMKNSATLEQVVLLGKWAENKIKEKDNLP